jgi:Flp pilus assembly protein TadB
VLDYFVGGLFRSDQAAPQAPADPAAATAEATTVLAYSLHSGQFSAEDRTRIGQLVAQRTGLSQADAEKRATEIYYRASTELANAEAAAKDAADKARKVAAHISLWFFVALLGGAFCASFAATIGGRQRDT